jgi:RNA polymerase sigma factor for flagellar operon FliA
MTPQQLIASCQGLVRSLAWKIHRKLPPATDLEDLIAYGQIGLAEAARDFDASRGFSFTTYAFHRVRGAIFDGLSKMNWFSHRDYHASRYEYMANEVLSQDAAAAPASATAEEDVGWLKSISGRLAVVNLATAKDGSSPDFEAEDTAQPSAALAAREIHQRLHQLIGELPEQAAQLIRASYFEGLTLQEAGKRLGISKSWASRLHDKALKQLARLLAQHGIDEAPAAGAA